MTVSCLVNRFDHLEIATANLSQMRTLLESVGFQVTQKKSTGALRQELMVQGQTRFLVSQGDQGTYQGAYVAKHGDGVCTIAFHSEDAKATLALAVERGATEAASYSSQSFLFGSEKIEVGHAAIFSFGDVRASFVNRSLRPFDVDVCFGEGFEVIVPKASQSANSAGLLSIDHLTNNVEMGKMEYWADFYARVYGWVEARYFDIKAAKTGLHSKVLQSPDGGIKIPVNEATEAKSQIQEFIDQHKGPGVQHIALTTTDIRKSVAILRERGIKFLAIPKTYYEDVPKRLTNFTEPINELEEKQILVDGDSKGYLLQVFTENQIGPMFFEIIQRKGHNGFGEGNFKALFEAIERDQERRGIL